MRSKVIQKSKQQSASRITPVHDIQRAIESSHRVLVASHIDPDGDAIGTQLAFVAYLRHLNKEVFPVRESEIPTKYQFLPDVKTIQHIDSFADDFTVDTVVVFECPNIDRIGRAARFLEHASTIINIDHHRDSGEFGTTNWIDPVQSSVGEMVFEYFTDVGFTISREIATQLYTAILTDTGRFRFQSTSPRTMHIAGELISAGANPKEICDHVFYNMNPSTMKLTARVLNTIEFYNNGVVCLLTLTNEMLTESGADLAESDGLVDFSLFTKGVVVGALLKEQDESNTRVSFRSRDGINVAELAARFGGGGHFNASGCTVPKGLAAAKKEILQILGEVQNG